MLKIKAGSLEDVYIHTCIRNKIYIILYFITKIKTYIETRTQSNKKIKYLHEHINLQKKENTKKRSLRKKISICGTLKPIKLNKMYRLC